MSRKPGDLEQRVRALIGGGNAEARGLLGVPLSPQTHSRIAAGILVGSLATAIVLYWIVYSQVRVWQVLAVLICQVLVLAIGVVSWLLSRRGKLEWANYLILVAVMLTYGLAELFWTGETVAAVLGGTVLLLAAAVVLFPQKWTIGLGAAIVLVLWIVIVNLVEPFPRYNVRESTLLHAVILGIVVTTVLVVLWRIFRIFNRGTIRTRLIVYFLLIVLLPSSIIIAGSAFRGSQAGRAQVTAQLTSVATLKEGEINAWVDDLIENLSVELTRAAVLNRVQQVAIEEDPDSARFLTAYSYLLDQLQQIVASRPDYEEIFILNTDGVVILSTNDVERGKIYSQESYFRNGLSDVYVAPPTYSPSQGRITVIVTMPIRDEEGQTIGVFAGRANLDTLSGVMQVRAGLGETGETYLIGGNQQLITNSIFPGYEAGQAYIRTEGANAAARQVNGSGEYEGYWGEPVIGVYRWLPELQVGLIAEQSAAEALRTTNQTIMIEIAITLVAVLGTVVLSVGIARNLARPITNLEETVTQIAGGELDLAARVERDDEIGSLARAFNSLTAQLRGMIGGLEQRVVDRTRELERRSAQLAAAAEVAREAAAIRDLDELMNAVVHLISDRFGFYHAGLFLLDEAGKYAVLRAASSEGGQRMLARRHRLEVGAVGIVGAVTGSGEPRIALDVGADAVYFDNPDMPYTRSEMALPLAVRGRVIGALDVQSTEAQAFTDEDVAILQTMADQVALAIDNANLLEESQQALRQLEVAYGEYTRTAWEKLTAMPAFEYDRLTVNRRPAEPNALVDQVVRKGEMIVVSEADRPSALVAPLRLREQVIGAITVEQERGERVWGAEEIELLEVVSDQIALAMDSVRLFQETQTALAETEALYQVSRELLSASTLQEVLQSAVNSVADSGVDSCFIVNTSEIEGRDVELLAIWDSRGAPALRRGTRLPHELLRPFLATQPVRTSVVVNTQRDERVNALFHQVLGPLELGSFVSVPMTVMGHLYGALVAGRRGPARYDEATVRRYEAIAGQTAVAIENLRLLQETRHRASQLAAAAEVSRGAAAILSVDQMLEQTVHLISERFGFYQAGIFLVDEDGEYAVMRAASSPGGQRMLDREHKLKVGEVGIVGYVAKTGAPRIALDVGADAVHFATPELPETRSEMALPLITAGRVIGVLDVQSTEEAAFSEDDVTILQTMSGQLAGAIENARLYQEAVQTAERLAEVDRIKSQFLANMSHELRTPLNSIIGFSRVILKGIDGPLTDMQRQDLEAIYKSGEHLLGLINDILDISKIEAGKMELAFEEVDMREVIRGVMSSAIALVKDKPVELQQHVADNVPIIVADERRVRQVILNLVSNAAKFTDHGYVRTEAYLQDQEVIVAVTDSGIGIPADKLSTIFEAFTQADASASRKYGGTGLGLAISKSFVEMHGGRMWVESVIDVGSTFYISLPVQGPPSLRGEEEVPAEEAVAAEPAASEEAQPAVTERLILCVDDDQGVITLFRRYLNKQGYQVVGLSDSSIVLEEAKRLKPQAITLDVMMPGKDGWQVIRELKEDPETQQIPVIMCSIVGDKGQGLSLGAADYLVKPILEQDLLLALQRLDGEVDQHVVLVVDDQPEARSLLRRMIEDQDGYEVLEASSGQEAIALVKQTRPHLIILDLMMPDVDGFTVLEAVKSDETTRAIPIIVVTAKDLTEQDHQRLNNHIEVLIRKGVLKQDELLEDVAVALRKLGLSATPVEGE